MRRMKDKIFVDSNIFLYGISNFDQRKREIASKIISEKIRISTQVINEVCSNLIKKFHFSNEDVCQFIEGCYNRYFVLNTDKNVFLSACDFREKFNISYYDSLIVATAFVSGCNILYTEDMRDGLVIEESLTIKNPFMGNPMD